MGCPVNWPINWPTNWPTNWKEIPLQQKKSTSSVLYISALPQVIARGRCLNRALGLSNSFQSIAQLLVEQLNDFQLTTVSSQQSYDFPVPSYVARLWSEFEIRADRSDQITFELSDRGLSYWLSRLYLPIQIPKPVLEPILENSFERSKANRAYGKLEKTEIEEHLWLLQHTFARCNSYLKQFASYIYIDKANQIDKGNQVDKTDGIEGSVAIANTFPSLTEKSARALIQAIALTADAMFWIPYHYPTKQYFLLLKQASELCQAFKYFHGDCLPQNKERSPLVSPCQETSQQLEITLVLAVRNMLKTLLEIYFQETAPASL